MCGPHQVWPLRSECCGRGVPTKVVCAECMKMCCLGGKNSVVKGLRGMCYIPIDQHYAHGFIRCTLASHPAHTRNAEVGLVTLGKIPACAEVSSLDILYHLPLEKYRHLLF